MFGNHTEPYESYFVTLRSVGGIYQGRVKMLFMHKIKNTQENSPEQRRKEPVVLLRAVDESTSDSSTPLSESKLALVEERRSMTKDFAQLGIVDLNGFVGACLVDSETGVLLAQAECEDFDSTVLDIDKVNSKIKAVKDLGAGDVLEDVVITLETQYHLVRRLKSANEVFIYLVIDRSAANLGLAKFTLQTTEESIIF